MKNLAGAVLFALIISNGFIPTGLLAVDNGPAKAAEVSKKKEIAVFPVYSAYNIPESAYMYFDDNLIGLLSGMKRFQVIGYQYRLDYNSSEQFIQKIRELKKEAVLTNPQYVDADLGVAVIPAAEMEKLANAFFIFIPSITGYHSEEYLIEIQEKRDDRIVIRLVKEYKTQVNISVKIITAEGNLLDTYNASSEEKSRDSVIDAYQKGVNSAISGLGFFLRNVEEFKIKSGVLDVNPNGVYIELGGNLGVKPGYEFAIQKNVTMLNKFNERINTGLLRVKEIGDQYSVATPIFGTPQVGDQVVEMPMVGARFNIFAGMMPMSVPGSIQITNSINSNTTFTNTQGFSSSSYVFSLGLNLEYEIGYAGLFEISGGFLFNNPLAYYGEIGGAYEFYFGRLSLTTGADLSVVGFQKYLGSLGNRGKISINGTTFYDNVDVNLYDYNFGIKPKLTFNYQFNQHTKLRITGGYVLYTPTSSYLEYSTGSGSTTVNYNLPISFSGPFGGVELVLRF